MLRTWGRHGRFNVKNVRLSFMAKTERRADSDCVIWTGCKGSHGRYGSVGFRGDSWLAHRLAFILFVGPIPKGFNICHRCDNGLCVNPAHLFLGTQLDNVLDMESKQRSNHPSCAAHGRSKLTPDDVAAIRAQHANGIATRAIARMYPFVSRTTITAVVKWRSWITK